MNILEEIVAQKKVEVAENKVLQPVQALEKSIYFKSPKVSLSGYIKRPDLSGVIAEFKRQSPSKGIINDEANVEKVSIGYMQAGASALSVLTDKKYFGGSNKDLMTARKFNFCPILRKDFIIDEYQIIEAKSIGADAILLIAAILTLDEAKQLTEFAHQLGLEVLLEIHDESELPYAELPVDVVGVNNRDLKAFKTSIENSIRIYDRLPADKVKISESGIHAVEDVKKLRAKGFDGFLIGENFMKQAEPELAARDFLKAIKHV